MLLLWGALILGFALLVWVLFPDRRTLRERWWGGGLFFSGMLLALALVSRMVHPPTPWAGQLGEHLSNALIHWLGWPFSLWLTLFFLLLGTVLLWKGAHSRGLGMSVAFLYVGLWGSLLLPFFLHRWQGVGILPGRLAGSLKWWLGPVGGLLLLNLLLFGTAALLLHAWRGHLRFSFPSPSSPPSPDQASSPGKELSVTPPAPPVPSSSRGNSPRSSSSKEVTSSTPHPVERELPTPTTDLIRLLKDRVETHKLPPEVYEKQARILKETLEEFGIFGNVVAYNPGPVVTRYEYEPAPGVKISRITQLADDLALRMKTSQIRIVAPLPNKGSVGIEVPNPQRHTVALRSLVEQEAFQQDPSPLKFVLGMDPAGHPAYTDLSGMPHLLIAGATGSGKSVFINTLIVSILLRTRPEQVRFLLVDPKRVELSFYEGVPHLLMPVIKDSYSAVEALKQAVRWMEYRYKLLAEMGVRDITGYNQAVQGSERPPMPYLVIVVDEFADLILTTRKDIEEPLARLAQMARAVGIHLVVATQRPSVDVITGTIKANFPVRIAFKVSSKVDARTIMDTPGAEKLLGKGDMLFLPPGESDPMRLHGAYISERDIRNLTDALIRQELLHRLGEHFHHPPGLERVVNKLMKKGHHIALTRSDEPGLDVRFEEVVRMLSTVVPLPRTEVERILRTFRDQYYRPIPELEAAPVPMRREWSALPEDEQQRLVLEVLRMGWRQDRRRISDQQVAETLNMPLDQARELLFALEERGWIGHRQGKRRYTWRILISPEEAREQWERNS